MELAEFHNGLRVLMNIDQPEFEATLDPDDRKMFTRMEAGWAERMWIRFRDHPHRYFIECCQSQTDKLFAIIQERNKK